MNLVDYKFYTDLKTKTISPNQAPKGVKNSHVFKNLIDAGILRIEKSGRGSKIIIKKLEPYEQFLKNNFPSDEIELEITKSNNIKRFRNSKAQKAKQPAIFFLRGFKDVELNNQIIDLKFYTTSYGLFSLIEPKIFSDKICFVENKDSFLRAEKLFGTDWVYLHIYGRIGIESIKGISAKEITVFVDLDFNGLDEFLRIKSVYSNAELYIPTNFKTLFDNYSHKIKGKQKASTRIKESKLSEVIMIRELVEKNSRFLEQEIMLDA